MSAMTIKSPAKFTDRTRIVVGENGLIALANARVAVYGLGGVGAACALDLVRAGVGYLHVFDFDIVETSNLNRLAFGFSRFVGRQKIEAFVQAAKEINPDIQIDAERIFFTSENAAGTIARECDIHADCIDLVSPKVSLLAALRTQNLVFISSMGTGGRLMPEKLKIGPMSEVKGCPLARAVRQRLAKMHIPFDFPVVWSDEPAIKPLHTEGQRGVQGSTPFVPQVAGHFMASWIVRKILESTNSALNLV